MIKKVRDKISLNIGHDDDDDDTKALVSSQSFESPLKMLDSMSVDTGSAEMLSLYRGLLFASISSLFFSLCSVIVKKLHYIHPAQLACLRFVGIFVFTLPCVIYRQQPLLGPRDVRWMLIMRGIAGSTSLYLRFYALRYLPIADASVIIFSVPVFVAVMAKVFLKEPCSVFHWISVMATLFGIALITKLPFLFGTRDEIEQLSDASSSDRTFGILAAISSTVFSASVYVLLRKLKDTDHFVVMLNFGWVAVIETFFLTLSLGSFTMPRSSDDLMMVFALCLFSFLGQVCLTRALQTEQAGPVSVVRATADIAFVFIWQISFFGEIPDRYSVSGAILVSLCVILTSVRKWVLSLPEHSAAKHRLLFLTF
ncbi:solute carrier family 35 member G1-like [Galendromus occidentalis]|uniref:Solute carrier family 35 member G1-like n=1 Tax=Galendromus occidentalis TaxID=34638 RepID=A0AAJ6QS23_9ACAR|nr:solute carrier family 35 member G1-like [Galendromus occidentalis]